MKVKDILKNHKPIPLDSDIKEKILAIVDRRMKTGG
jgi:trimethylamine:corrinoid methyltransferase-like protein